MTRHTDQKRDVFVAIADPTRRILIRLLADEDELPLHKITPHFQIGRAAVSKHLLILKETNLVTNRKMVFLFALTLLSQPNLCEEKR